MIKAIVSVGYVGFLRPASGTWGSAAALIPGVALLFGIGWWALLIGAVLAYFLGVWAIGRYTSADKDPSEVVIDELVGQWIAILPAGVLVTVARFPNMIEWALILCAFFLFRGFDIWKPGIIGRIDARGGATGVMLDDVVAGIYAAIATFALYFAIAWISIAPYSQM